MARESVVYAMALQQTVIVTVRASDHLPDPSLVTSCTVEAIDHSDDSAETWPSTIAEGAAGLAAAVGGGGGLGLHGLSPRDPPVIGGYEGSLVGEGKVEARAGSGAGSGVPLSPPCGERVAGQEARLSALPPPSTAARSTARHRLR